MIKKTLILISCIFLLSSCSVYKVTSQDITDNYYSSKASTKDVAYIKTISKPHEVIGYITVNAERRQPMDEVLEKIKREAAILGGDAITDIKTDATGQWKSLPAQKFIGNAYVRANFTATVVAFE
ncbi:MAG: hypothetical protein P9X22_01800 [Candidatus Zapsychrus exili]|nr:hypothetical protein [Candidatus Zapsychrus exili]